MVPSPYKSASQIASATPIFQLRLNDTINVDSTMDNKRPSTGNLNNSNLYNIVLCRGFNSGDIIQNHILTQQTQKEMIIDWL